MTIPLWMLVNKYWLPSWCSVITLFNINLSDGGDCYCLTWRLWLVVVWQSTRSRNAAMTSRTRPAAAQINLTKSCLWVVAMAADNLVNVQEPLKDAGFLCGDTEPELPWWTLLNYTTPRLSTSATTCELLLWSGGLYTVIVNLLMSLGISTRDHKWFYKFPAWY